MHTSRSTPALRTAFVVGLALAAAASAALAKPQNIDKVNGAIRAESGVEYGSLETVNGSIRIDRDARVKSASTVNGGIRIAEGATVGTAETVNGGIELGEGAIVERGAETVNGGIGLGRASRIDGGVETVNGRIELEQAEINGGIRTVNGNITVGEGSTVRGGIHIEKPSMGWFNWGKQNTPRVVIGPNAVVEGELVFEREVELFVHDSARIGRVQGAEAKRFSGQ